MAARTTAAAVMGILAPGKDYDGKTSLTPFIDTATVLVDDVEQAAIDAEDPHSAAKLELIERWAAAHFYKCSDRPYRKKSTDKAGGDFDGQTGTYMEATLYGQMAMALDTSGYLRATSSSEERRVAGGAWLGEEAT